MHHSCACVPTRGCANQPRGHALRPMPAFGHGTCNGSGKEGPQQDTGQQCSACYLIELVPLPGGSARMGRNIAHFLSGVIQVAAGLTDPVLIAASRCLGCGTDPIANAVKGQLQCRMTNDLPPIGPAVITRDRRFDIRGRPPAQARRAGRFHLAGTPDALVPAFGSPGMRAA